MKNNKGILFVYLCLNILLFTGVYTYINGGNVLTVSNVVSAQPPIILPDITDIPIINKDEDVKPTAYRALNVTQTITPDGLTTDRIIRSYKVQDVVVTASAVNISRYALIPENTDPNRLKLLNTGSYLIGNVPYFWGGKAPKTGWNNEWGTDVVVTDSSISVVVDGELTVQPKIEPYGLDCSGFVDWCYWTGLGYRIGTSSTEQWHKSRPITEEELLPGDLAFLYSPATPLINHVGIYIGKDSNGNKKFIHCASGVGVTVSSPNFRYYRRPYIDIYQ